MIKAKTKNEIHCKAVQQESCEKEELGLHEQISGFYKIEFTELIIMLLYEGTALMYAKLCQIVK